MAEQDFTEEKEIAVTNDDSASNTTLFSHLERLETRFQDAYLIAANDEDGGQAEADSYPIDAFFRACSRHLRFGQHLELEEMAANDEEPEETLNTERERVIRSSLGKGPSYAL